MATLEVEEPVLPSESSFVVVSRKTVEATRAAAGADDKLSLKSIVSLAITVMVCAVAPNPWSLIGVAATVILALELARMAWKKK